MWSDVTVAAIDAETRAIVTGAAGRAVAVVSANREVLEELASELIAVESLEGAGLDRLLSRVTGPVGPGLPDRIPEPAMPVPSDLALVS